MMSFSNCWTDVKDCGYSFILEQQISDILPRIISTWMYQFWLFSFKTAKHWGRGPRDWTSDLLGFGDYHQRRTIPTSLPPTPGRGEGSTPMSHSTPHEGMTPDTGHDHNIPPSPLCRWSIHVKHMDYERIPSPPSSPNEHDVEERWQGGTRAVDFTKKLPIASDNRD